MSLKRSFSFATLGAPLLLVATLSSCGDDDSAGSTVVIQSSSFTTQLSATTGTGTAAPSSGSLIPGQTVPGTQVYEVQPGDFLSGIAADHGIPVDSIVNFNDWPEGIEHVLQPGDIVNIPPGAQVPEPEDEEDEDSDETDEPEATEEEDEEQSGSAEDPPLCPDGSRQGTYTIQEGDIPGNVAEDLDVRLDQLNEANANTPGYDSFIVGVKILVPCGGEEPDSTD